jgi:outer membrane receptor for ferrienterochelin and colicins
MRWLLSICFMFPLWLFSQVSGRLVGPEGPIGFGHATIVELKKVVVADLEGRFVITDIARGIYTLKLTAIGHEPLSRRISVGDEALVLGDLQLPASVAQLDEVVVTGTMREVSRSDSPVPVEIISPQLFRRNPDPALIDAVGMVNGVRPQINCSVCNTGDIHINGMEGPYTMVLIDGMPIVSGLSTVYGLSGIPTSLVERVEIVKGPGSALYGSEAMGGIINVITKDPVLAPRFSADVMATTWHEHNVDLGLKLGKGKVSNLTGINVFQYDFPIDGNTDGFTDVTLQKRMSVFNKIALRRPDRRVASLAGRFVYEDRWGGEMDWTPQFAGSDSIYGESISTRRWEVIGQYQLPMHDQVMFQVSMNGHQQDSWYGITPFNATQQVFFSQLFWSRKIGARHDLLSGLAYRYTIYNDNTPATSVGMEPFTTDRPQQRPLPGLFLQDEWSLTELQKLLVGYRLDNDLDHGLVHSPRIAYKYAPSGRWALRASFGTGYRVVNVFTEDHAALTGSRSVLIEEDLRPETSWNGTINIVRKWIGAQRFFELDGSIFHTRFGNRIIPDYDTDPDLIIYKNLQGEGVSQGVSLNFGTRLGDDLKLHAGASYMQVYVEENGSRWQQYFAPEWSGTFNASYEVTKKTTFDLTGQWYGPMRLPILPNDFRPEYSPTYALLNLQVRHKFNERWEIYGGMKNLLDFIPKDPLMRPFDPFDRQAEDPVANPHGYRFDTTYMYAPLHGRRGFFGVRWLLQ